MKNLIKSLTFISLILLISFLSFGQLFENNSAAKPKVEAKVDNRAGIIIFNLSLEPDNHITDLKNGFFKIEIDKNDYIGIKGVTFPEGVTYGEENVFKGDFDVKVYLNVIKKIPLEGIKVVFKVSYQVCQEKPVEVCYPPDSEQLEVTISSDFKEGKSSQKNVVSNIKDKNKTRG